MSVTSKDDLIERAQLLMGSSVDLIPEDSLEQLAEQAIVDIGVSTYPITDPVLCKWAIERMRRHMTYLVMVTQAHSFKVKQLSLQQRFDNYLRLIDKMDKDWQDELENNPHKFAGVSESHLFGSKIDAGFAYESQTGIDLTYVDANKVGITPEDTD